LEAMHKGYLVWTSTPKKNLISAYVQVGYLLDCGVKANLENGLA